MLDRIRKATEVDLNLAANQIGPRALTAAIGHMNHVDSGRNLEEFACNVGEGPIQGCSTLYTESVKQQ